MTEPERATSQEPQRVPGHGQAGGEAACALHRVCEDCGALEDGPPAPVCPRCGAARGG